jgi:CHASE3 domain sensor protein
MAIGFLLSRSKEHLKPFKKLINNSGAKHKEKS